VFFFTFENPQNLSLDGNLSPNGLGHLLMLGVNSSLRVIEVGFITNGHLLFVMGALILQRAQKCKVRQVTRDVVKSEV